MKDKTTVLAVSVIGTAMTCRGEKIFFEDHHNTRQSNIRLMKLSEFYVKQMGLSGFEFNPKSDMPYVIYRF